MEGSKGGMERKGGGEVLTGWGNGEKEGGEVLHTLLSHCYLMRV